MGGKGSQGFVPSGDSLNALLEERKAPNEAGQMLGRWLVRGDRRPKLSLMVLQEAIALGGIDPCPMHKQRQFHPPLAVFQQQGGCISTQVG